MCRLFGFRSVIKSQVHTSLVSAENALETQSNHHPDGWGVSYYVAGAPHIVKSEKKAINDNLFKKVSGVVSSETVLAHIRKATLGSLDILNTHPFQFGSWVFAHNGNIKNFDQHRDSLVSRIAPELRRFILGSTDSEVIFYFILSHLSHKVDLAQRDCPIDILALSIRQAVKEIINIVGDYSQIDNAGETETYLTFILTNGSSMIGHQAGKNLYYSTYKSRCADRDLCPSFSPECEAPTKSGFINHLLFSSEQLKGENIWHSMQLGQMIGVDAQMNLKIYDADKEI